MGHGIVHRITKKIRNRRRAPSRSRKESNLWLRRHCGEVRGDVLSIGSGDDSDGEGNAYRDYFGGASLYRTSEVTSDFGSDLVIDVQSMPEVSDCSYDCVFCSGVLEHVEDFQSAVSEITRILKANGTLFLGLPFRQAIHMPPQDFWRFTEHGVRRLLSSSYTIEEITAIDESVPGFPAAYWVKARKMAVKRPHRRSPTIDSVLPPTAGESRQKSPQGE